MKLGCCAYSYRQFLTSGEMTLEEFIDRCEEMGLDGVELTAYYFPSTAKEYLHHLKRYCFSKGLHIAGTAVGSNFCQADEAARREQVQMTKEWIDHSVTLGAPCIRVFAGPVPEGHREEEAFQWAVACLGECAEYGASRGVVVALENHGGITATADQVEKLVQAVNHEWFGVNLDFGNYRTPPAEYEQTAPHAVTCHAKTHYRNPAGQKKEVDYAQVVKIMRRVGYKGYLNIEYEEAEDPRLAVPRFAAQLKALL